MRLCDFQGRRRPRVNYEDKALYHEDKALYLAPRGLSMHKSQRVNRVNLDELEACPLLMFYTTVRVCSSAYLKRVGCSVPRLVRSRSEPEVALE